MASVEPKHAIVETEQGKCRIIASIVKTQLANTEPEHGNCRNTINLGLALHVCRDNTMTLKSDE